MYIEFAFACNSCVNVLRFWKCCLWEGNCHWTDEREIYVDVREFERLWGWFSFKILVALIAKIGNEIVIVTDNSIVWDVYEMVWLFVETHDQ